MAKCSNCGKELRFLEDIGFYGQKICKECNREKLISELPEDDPRKLQAQEQRSEAEELEVLSDKAKCIILTTETCTNLEIKERIDVITAECVFGMNIFKDIFASARDILGGRSKVVQNTMRDARKTVLKELRREAAEVGADAVVGIDLDYSEISGNGSKMLFLVASGTAVRIK
jgi:uncharacterized protein YbjQ (UPF0145 family)/DNA-directed RNA polymerase subunit RPC12/RpoP